MGYTCKKTSLKCVEWEKRFLPEFLIEKGVVRFVEYVKKIKNIVVKCINIRYTCECDYRIKLLKYKHNL